MRRECCTNDTSATRVKNFDFDNDTSKSIFSHPYIYYMASERLQREEQFYSKNYLLEMQICEPQTYEMWVITFYSDSATVVSSTGRTLVGDKEPENVWLFEPSRLLETIRFL